MKSNLNNKDRNEKTTLNYQSHKRGFSFQIYTSPLLSSPSYPYRNLPSPNPPHACSRTISIHRLRVVVGNWAAKRGSSSVARVDWVQLGCGPLQGSRGQVGQDRVGSATTTEGRWGVLGCELVEQASDCLQWSAHHLGEDCVGVGDLPPAAVVPLNLLLEMYGPICPSPTNEFGDPVLPPKALNKTKQGQQIHSQL